MIRAHMASYPARQSVMLNVIERLLPQIDHLFLVLNEYSKVPEAIKQQEKITVALSSENLKDVGKFYFAPEPDDTVFLVDDDIAYPDDYVSKTLELVDRLGYENRCYAYFGNALSFEEGRVRWRTYMFDKALGRVRGASIVGTGTVCVMGRHMPPLDYMKEFIGMCDLGFCNWQLEHENLPWLLTRDENWLQDILPQELSAETLYNTVHKSNPMKQQKLIKKFALEWPHSNQFFKNYYQRSVG